MKDRDDTPQKPKDEPRPTKRSPQSPESPKTHPPAEEVFSPESDKCRLLIESSPLGIAVIESNGRYNYLNPKFREMFGYTLDDIPTGQEWFAQAFPDPAYRRQAISDWKLYLKESQTGEAEPRIFRVTCKDGSAKVIKFRAVPLENGEQFILSEDITELQRAEGARREAEELFRVLYESAADAFLLHEHGKILEVNQQACDSLGYSREELLGMSITDIEVDTNHEELVASWRRPQPHARTALGVQKRKDGSTFPVEVRASDLYYRGRRLRLALIRDITERRQAEEALRESEERFRLLSECGDPYCLHDDGRILEVNQQACDNLGYSREELLGMTIFDLDVGIGAEKLRELWRQPSADPRTYQSFHRRKDGSTFPVEVKASHFDFRGQTLRLGVARDITERLQAEAALKESELKYRTLVEQIPAVIYTAALDEQSPTLYVSPQVEAILDFSPADFEADPDIWVKQLHPEDRDRVLAEVARCHQTGEPLACEYRMVGKDGRIVWFRDEARLVRDPSGRQLSLQGVTLDITERKLLEEALQESEAHYRTLFETSPYAISLADANLKVTKANKAAATLYGAGRPEELLGKNGFDFVSPESLALAQELSQEAQSTADMIDAELVLLKTDGSPFIGEVRTSVIRNADGSPREYLSVVQDITERKWNEEKLLRAKEEWERTFNAIPDMVMILDMEYRIVRVNRKMAHKFGCAPEEMEGKTCYRVVHGLEAPPSFCPCSSPFPLDLPVQMEVWSQELQSYLLITTSPIYDSSGSMVGFVHVGTDITGRKLAEEALRKSEERYRLIAENVSDVIWTTDLDLRYTYISPSVQQLQGFAPEEVVGKNIGEFLHPASLEQALEVISEELAREEQGLADPDRSRMLEIELFHKDGYIIQAEVKARFLHDAHHQPVAILGVTRDITQRKEAEEALIRREATLEAVSFGAEKFLTSNDWRQDIQEILERLGRALEVSRVLIFENHAADDGTLLIDLRHEWVEPTIKPEIDNPEFQGFSFKAGGFGRWEEVMPQGQIIWGHVAELPPPEKEVLAALDIKSVAAVPIFVGQQWWGGIVFNECTREREWSSLEIDALLTAASILGLTILHQKEEKALRDSEEKLRSLSYQLLNAQEQERKRLATELHNFLGHDLLLLKLKLESLQEQLGPEHLTQEKVLRQILRALQKSVRNVRRLCQDLIPGDLEDLGLTTALHHLVENFAVAQRLKWQTELDDLHDLFEVPVQIAIYRMVQEALTNIGKHARAHHLWLQARRRGTEVSFIIEDDGQGFKVAEALAGRKTLGLLAMEERLKILGGTFNLVSRKKEGTKITFTIPILKGGN